MSGSDSPFTISRRQFFPALLREIAVHVGVAKGGSACQLGDLREMPDDQLAVLIPAANPAFEIELSRNQIRVTDRTGQSAQLLPCSEEEFLVVGLFDGERTLLEIGKEVAVRKDCDAPDGFALAKAVFLRFIETMLFIPKNAAPPV